MRLRILFVLAITVFQAWAIKESSKQMLINDCPAVRYTAAYTGTPKQDIQDLPLSASADKYADVLLDWAKGTAGYPKGGYWGAALKACELVEKLATVEKVSSIKLRKARSLKEKYTKSVERLERAHAYRKKLDAPYTRQIEPGEICEAPPVQNRHLLVNRRL